MCLSLGFGCCTLFSKKNIWDVMWLHNVAYLYWIWKLWKPTHKKNKWRTRLLQRALASRGCNMGYQWTRNSYNFQYQIIQFGNYQQFWSIAMQHFCSQELTPKTASATPFQSIEHHRKTAMLQFIRHRDLQVGQERLDPYVNHGAGI